MKLLVIVGTRPECIRLSLILKKLEQWFDVILVHTGQNYDKNLNDIFFKELEIKQPEYCLGLHTSNFGEQIGMMFSTIEEIILIQKPQKVLILGDTNSALTSIVAEKHQIPVFHMEAGNRSFCAKVPEEINRKLIDSISSYNLPYTERSKENLLKDGVPKERIFVTGNPIYEVINHYESEIERSEILRTLNLQPFDYFLATFHRAENVDVRENLNNIIKGLELIAVTFNKPVICSTHPRTAQKIKEFNIEYNDLIKLEEPFGFFDFIHLEKYCSVVLSDSGTISEDACILKTPNVILRDVTERIEVIEAGGSILAGTKPEDILRATKYMLQIKPTWNTPDGYLDLNVSDKICSILLSNYNWVERR